MDIIVPDLTPTALSTLRCLRSLKREGHRLWSVGERSAMMPALFSWVAHQRLTYPPGGLVPFLLGLRTRLSSGAKPLLLLTSDAQVVEVSRRRAELAPHYEFLLPEPADVDRLMEKTRFAAWAREQGWPVPRTEVAEDPAALLSAAERLRFPLVVKPYLVHSQKVATPGELRDFAAGLAPLNYRALVLQEWVPGGDDQLFFCYLLFDRSGEVVRSFLGQKLRQYPLSSGATSLGISVADRDGLVGKSAAVLRAAGYRGYGSVEYKRDPRDGSYWIMEPTVGRFNLQIALAEAAGVNFPADLCRVLTGAPVPTGGWKEGMTWIYEFDDLKAYLQGDRRYGYWSQFFKCHVNVLFAWSDPGPFLYELWSRLGNFLRRRVGK